MTGPQKVKARKVLLATARYATPELDGYVVSDLNGRGRGACMHVIPPHPHPQLNPLAHLSHSLRCSSEFPCCFIGVVSYEAQCPGEKEGEKEEAPLKKTREGELQGEETPSLSRPGRSAKKPRCKRLATKGLA